jgi:hypothetical protein
MDMAITMKTAMKVCNMERAPAVDATGESYCADARKSAPHRDFLRSLATRRGVTKSMA